MRADEVDFSAQEGKVNRKVIVFRFIVKAPNPLHDGFLGQKLAGIAQKQFHQQVLLGYQLDALSRGYAT